MKLLTKTTLYIATLSLFLFFLMGIVFFQVLKVLSINDLEREMKEMRKPVETNLPLILEHGLTELPGIDSLIIKQLHATPGNLREFRDTILFDTYSNQYRTYHIHSYIVSLETGRYQVDLIKSTTPADKLVERVTLMMTLMVILFLSGIFFLNRFMFGSLWKDFFRALDKLRRFDTEKGAIVADESDIQEFNELNLVLERITERLSEDYMELKDYTDHTTHELQTPLAVINSKAELLLQSENLHRAELETVRDIYKSADHLSRLNATLALITRIENRQYREKSGVNFASLIDQQLDMLQELIGLRNIKVRKRLYSRESLVQMDKGLADVLIVNLLKNAISHNIDGGIIDIELSEVSLIIRNSGVEDQLDRERLFDRFYRGSVKSDSFGLGLSLVKKICEYYGFIIEYHFEGTLHSFQIILP